MTQEHSSAFAAASHLTVGPEHAGQRIDNFLIARLKGVPKVRVYRLLRKGEVRVNRGRIRQDYRLREGDVVRIPPMRRAPPPAPASPHADLLARIEGAVVHEDAALIVLDKPSGMAVHGGSGRSYGIIEALRAARPPARFLELVHRLDKDTSGCLLVAKKASALRALHASLRGRDVTKRYLALVGGAWEGGERRVAAPLRKNVLSSGERIVRIDADGREAVSRFRCLDTGAEAALVEVQIGTGRTHQIRVHAASLGHPLAGDEKYGDRAFNKRMRERGLKRLFLHASELSFAHPASGETLHVRVPLPAELLEVLERMGLHVG